MPKFRLQRRALAVLGALLLVVSMLSMFCAAKPLPLAASPLSPAAFDLTTTKNAERVLNTSDHHHHHHHHHRLTEQSMWTQTMRPPNRTMTMLNANEWHPPLDANGNYSYYYQTTTPNIHHKTLDANTLPHSDQTIADKSSETTAFSELNLDAVNARPAKHRFDNLNEVRRSRRLLRRLRRHRQRRNVVSTEFGREPSTSNDDANDTFLSTTSSSDYHAIVTSFSSTSNASTTASTTTSSANQRNDFYDKSSTQSVFLDFLNNNNFDVAQKNATPTGRHKPNENGIKMMPAISKRRTSRRTARSLHTSIERTQRKKALRNGNDKTNLERIERSANLSLTKTTKRLQLLIKSRLLQLLPDGTVNGTQSDESEYTILQRSTVGVGQIRLVGIATCLYLCMDACGNLYGSRDFSNDCIFNERMEDNYNYYTSTHHSTALRTFYVALNRLGGPRVTYLPANKSLGKLSTYVKSFTLIVPEHRSDALIARLFGANHVKHGIKHLCDSGKELIDLNAKTMRRPECQVNQKVIVPTKRPTYSNNRNHSHNKRVPSTAPAALIDRKQQHNGRNMPINCTSADECPKKKKKLYGRNGGKMPGSSSGSSSGNGDAQEPKAKQKPTKSAKKMNKNSRRSPATTVMPSTPPPPPNGSNGNRFQSMSPRRWPALDDATTGGHFDDALNDSSSASIPIMGNGHAALNNDDDDDDNIDYDDR